MARGAQGRPVADKRCGSIALPPVQRHIDYDAAIAAGGRDNGRPGVHPEYSPGDYGAFVLDPDGYDIEAVYHELRPA